MYKIAVMGDRDSVSGFASLGLEIFPEEDAERAATTLRKMISSGYAVIFMTESWPPSWKRKSINTGICPCRPSSRSRA